jgi:tetratricopeptide (TPR) repeat protein
VIRLEACVGHLIRITVVSLLLVGVARAENRPRARELFREAQQHYKLGEFQAALDGFKEAYRNFEDPSLLFNIAQTERQLGHKQEALRSYRMFLSETPNAPNRAEVERVMASLEQAIKDEAAAQPPHETLPPTPPPQQTAPVVTAPPPPPPERHHTWWMVGVGAALLGAGAAGIATGAGMLAVNGNATCTLATGQVRCPQVYDTAAEGGALLGVGIAAAIGGAVLIAVEEKRYHSPVRADLRIGPSGGAFVLSGAF